MTRLARLAIIAGAILLAATTTAPQARAQSITERREAAVLQARAGHMDAAIAALRTMFNAGEDDGLVGMDLTALLQQAGDPAGAILAFEKAAVAEPPDYALLAATRAYRDLKRYDVAENLARQGVRRFPDQTAWPMLLSLVLTDAGRPREALDALEQPAAQRAPRLEWLLAQGYAWRRAGDPFRALSAYADALRLAPANDEARTAAAALLAAQGGAYGAAALAKTDAPYAADEVAAMVRWGEDLQASAPARRYEGTDAAIARLDRLIADLPPPPTDDALRRRLRLDRLVALRDRLRMPEVVNEADALKGDAALPPHAEAAFADALLYLRRPKEARRAYRAVLAASPDLSGALRTSALYGVFYASVELEDFRTAYATIDALVREAPVWRSFRDTPARSDNPDRAYAEVAAANARYYGNQLAEAWARITKIADAAPANATARMARYDIVRARGWTRRAEVEGEIAASLAPDALASRIARVEIAMADYRYAEAKRMVADLLAAYPEDLRVQGLARDLGGAMGWLLQLEAKPSDSEGGGTNASGQALHLQGRLTTPPIADHWRLFALGDYASAHPPEGFVERPRAGAGAEWRSRDVAASLYANDNWGTLTKPGGGATFDWTPSDQLRIAFAGEFYSWETPLRAVLHGITADQVSMRLTYRWDESRNLSANFGYTPFTDGNQRYQSGVAYTQKLINLPHFDLTATGDAYVSSNDRPQAPYFNPDRDLTVDGGLLAEQTIWRRYDNSLTQALSVNVGLYEQAHFPSEPIATVSYAHRWRFDPWMEVAYGVELSRRVYDGVVENTAALTLRLARRF
ncbi:poly-beta-1,6 N-acetyl-D-glucosamine export porin PgaA [Phenylobacterium sp.]|uniref:poly-beta-1,6 N-acetyl-D-glucosamine export porin PgaA n=1 Tax=Phenylobacterium sp. TaxID=1871053 RepID=UPI002F42B381